MADNFEEFDLSELGDIGMKIRHRATIALPLGLTQLMFSIRHHLKDPGAEYMIYLKGRWDPMLAQVIVEGDASMVHGESWFMPPQEASSTFVRALGNPPGPEWNVAVHRHPPGVRGFSGTDERDINQNFLASLLYIPPDDWPAAIINIPLDSNKMSRLQVPAGIVFGTEGNFDLAHVSSRHKPLRPPRAEREPVMVREHGLPPPNIRPSLGLKGGRSALRQFPLLPMRNPLIGQPQEEPDDPSVEGALETLDEAMEREFDRVESRDEPPDEPDLWEQMMANEQKDPRG